MNTIENIKNIIGNNIYYKKLNEDIISYLLVEDYIKQPYYFPITSSSLKFHTLAVLLNDIILNKRQSCLEFGSGISTLAISKLIKTHNLKCTFYSIEDNEEWFDFMKSSIIKSKLEEYVNLIYAPLMKTGLALEGNSWYSVSTLNDKLKKDLRFDLVIVDGPGAWKPEIKLSRYAALPYTIDKLANSCSVYLDDINRKGEKRVIRLWEREFKIRFEKINNTTAVYIKGSKTNIIL